MRSTIALLPLVLALGTAACDKPNPANEQATATVPQDSGAPPANDAASASVDSGRADKVDRTHAGEVAPATPFKAPDGKTVTLAAFKGKPLLLNLWATWCAPCVREMPTLDRLAVRETGKLQVVVVSQDLEGAEKVAPFFQKAGFKALQPYLDTNVALSTGYGVNLPTTILYDSAGKEIWRVSGEMAWDGDAAGKLIGEAK